MAQTQSPASVYQDRGDAIDYTPASAVYGGDIVLVGTVPCLVTVDIAANVKGSVKTDGVWKIPKTSDTFTAGDAVYWDADGDPVTGTAGTGAADSSAATGNLLGMATADAATGDDYVYVKANGMKRTATIAGSVTADDITATDSSLGIAGIAAAQGGAIVVTGGTSSTAGNAGGAVSLVGGTPGVTGAGGAASVTGGIGGATSGTGGAASLKGGAGTAGNANGGAVTIQGGEPHGSGQQGTVIAQGLITQSGTTAVAITGATTLTLADSGGIFTVSQGAAYDIDLPSPTVGAGVRMIFQLVAPAANTVTLTVAGGAATFEGSLHTEGAIVVATGSTLTFVSGTALLGDNIEVISTATGKYFVRAFASASGGITIS
jgi:predicted RecA/RadA family phage recombinase